ncbi:hypothetical protein IFM89_004548 [Coptis chinensis]|uniref:Vacuolar protein sorting-associated protein 13 VPS13 adaptor binding domain-containing protein n=1 Tax=Coptis chinensis TaxID=261450 RepID=A0A835H1W9_9MAGN|nr:hypothetical protein IFM89_004548 [Coptis chinensis]
MVVELGSLLFKSRNAAESPSSVREHQHTMCSTSNDDLSPGIQLEDFYDHFEFLFTNSEVSVLVPDRHHAISIFERFSGSLSLASCILDETVLKQLKVHFSISSLCAHFSPLIYGALVGMIAFLDTLKSKGSKQRASGVSEFCVSADLKYISFHINIGDDENDSMVIILHLTDIDILCALQEAMECWLSIKMVEISSCTSAGESISHTLCSTRNLYTMDSATQPKTGVGTGIFYCAERSASAGGCFLLHYQAQGSVAIGCPKYSISLMDLDLHIYPDIVGLLLKFFDNLPGYGSSSSAHSCKSAPISNIGIDDTILRSSSELPNFGFSNFYEAGSTALEGIPLDHFPFLTINNSGSLGSLEQSLIHKNFEWRRAFSVRDNKSIRRPDLSFTRKSRSRLCEPEGSGDTKLNVIDLNLSGIKAYFHDSSCILCTVTLSVCKSSFVVDGTECLDMLISIDGLLLSSSWYTHDSCEFLWGSSAPSNSHILNIHLRKKTGGALTRTFEISFSVQHVSCVLPSEFLAILIGYFCLPDWTPHGHDTCITENCKERDTDNYVILWKVEILESTLILPVECSRGQSLHLGLKQLYISFTTVKHREDALKEIPIDCRVSEKMIVDNVHLLNIFGRDLCMSLVLLEDKENISAKLDKNTLNGNITLISPLDLDIWIRIPSENKPFVGLSAPTCIMMEIKICQINAEDDFFLFGVQSVLNVVDELSAVGTLSEGFKSDIFQFLQFKKMLKEGSFVLPDASCVSFREVRCRAKSLSIRLCRSRPGHFVPPELVAKVDMEVELSASFRNDIPLCLDIECSSLMLYSFHSRVILVQCKSDGSVSSGAGIHLEKSNRVENKLLVNLPFVEIWLHLSDWSKVIELLVSYSEQLSRISFMIASSKNSDSSLTAANIEDCSSLIVKSEIIGASVHYPLLVIADAFSESREAENKQEKPWDYSSNILGEEPVLKGRHHQYITITLQSRESELVISGEHAIFNCSVEEARGMLDIVHDQRVLSWSLFQLFQANVVADICFKEQKQHTSVNIQVDSLDMSISHQLFYIWNILGYQTPETGTFQYLASVMDLKVQLRKASLLLTDGTCSCNGPILEILLKNLVLHSDTTGSAMEASFASDMLVNYLNIQKVMWEPFIETWDFKLDMIRTQNQSSFLNTSSVTDIHLTSTAQLNLNLTVPGIEAIFRLKELIKKVQGEFGLNDLLETQRCLGVHTTTSTCTRRYAPYVLQNETSLPLLFQVSRLTVNEDDLEISAVGERNIVYPGSSVPVFTDETSQEQNFQYRPPQSSDLLTEKKSYGIARDVISIQLDGTSGPCVPISMDVVGLSYFEVNFSKASEKEAAGKNEKKRNTVGDNTFVVPVVFDVSMLHYRKLIRIYSTVILLNTTSIPLELHFDTPFGVSPKEFPLPLHLAEAGRMICRPLGTSFLWSEAHMFSKVLAQETKLGSFRSFVCYPSHPSSDPFRCCLSIQLIDLPSSSGRMNGSSVLVKETMRHSIHSKQREYNVERSKIPSIHYVTLTTPLLIRNYMPREVSLTIETGGIARTVMISEVNCASIFHIDSTHDLGLVFHVNGFRPSASKFLRAEAFAAVARFHENKFSLSETLTFYPNSSSSPIYVTVEKTMDALCGAREVGIFVPFLLYNCTGLPLNVADLGHELEGCSMPPCYHLIEMDQLLGRRHSLSPLTSKQDLYAKPPTIDNSSNFSSKDRSMSLPGNVNLDSGRYSTRLFTNPGPSTDFLEHLGNHGLYSHRASLNDLTGHDTSSRSHYSDHLEIEKRKVEACMYCPHSSSSASELMVRLRICMPGCITDNEKSSVWSSPFYLVPASGSTCVVVPRTNTSGAFIVSVTSSPLTGPFSGRTRAITFQPRYVISNACSKDLCYKQKGTDSVFHLRVGQHSHLHWADPTRDLLVSLVYNEPGWLWSGSFFPDHLGDTQVKMRNYVHGALSMIRVEVHNADVTIEDEKIVGSPNGNSGTLLILLYDDDTGFIPYRIDNFSKERLRIYQENCKAFETTIHSYMSCPYTWDEPCYPHRLVVEVLGERVLGSYTIDDVTEQIPIYLPSTSEKPGRQLFLSIHADGAVKVLSLLDSSYLPDDMKDSSISGIKEKTKFDQKEEIFVEFSERISVHIPYIGVSMIDSCPQELLFVSANDTMIDLMQNAQVQKFYFQISSLQVDNQLHNTAYPVILSLDHESGGNSSGQMKNKDDNTKLKNGTVMHIASEGSCQPIFFFSASKRRNKEISLIFFEYIKLRLAALRLELEEELIVCMFDFVRSTILKLSRGFPCLDSALDPLSDGTVSIKDFCPHATHYESLSANRRQIFPISVSKYLENRRSNPSLPSVVPIEDFWQQIYFLARRQNKIYIEVFDLAPIKLTLSFSSGPWMLRNEGTTSAEYLRPISGTAFQRGLMALADVEGAPVYLKQLTITHHMGTLDSFHEILIRHFTPELLHEMYKIFGSASVIGNPMGFAKNLGLGIKDFLSVPATGILKSPSGLFTGMAQGITSLFYSTVYASSTAATQFSKSVHKSIVAFTFDDQAISTLEKQWTGLASHSKGVLNEFLEGLTGLLQSPIRGAEKHGLPGFLSGVALGTAGVVARPVASILEVTGKTAQSIRNRSRLHRSHRFRARFPRPLTRELPLQPYSWEEAIGISMLQEADDVKFKDEIFVTCRTLKQKGEFLIITERFVLVVLCPSLVGFGTPEFRGVADPQWILEVEMSLDNVISVGRQVEQVNIVGINSETTLKEHQHKIGIRKTKWWSQSTLFPLFQTSIELASEEEADNVLRVIMSTIEKRKQRGLRVLVLHRSDLR